MIGHFYRDVFVGFSIQSITSLQFTYIIRLFFAINTLRAKIMRDSKHNGVPREFEFTMLQEHCQVVDLHKNDRNEH